MDVTLLPAAVGIARARAVVDALVGDGRLNSGQGNSWTVKLDAESRSLDRGNTNAALGQLNASLNPLRAMMQSVRLTAAEVQAMREVIERVIANLGG